MEEKNLTSDIQGHRTLATVVFTDCVGFSARMSENEDHTLYLIRRDLKIIKRICEEFEGRVLKSTGDGLLMHFTSAIKAIECSVEIQNSMKAAAAKLPPQDVLQHRIGVHLADMFITATDVMGNGVNIAARLQSEADSGGICLSQTVYDVIKNTLDIEMRYLGPRELKNIREVVPVYKVLMEPETEPFDPYAEAAKQLAQHPNVARIKKLMFYTCTQHWESDPVRLDQLDLQQQVRDLLQLASDAAALRQRLLSAVKTLSKPTEYAIVAETILGMVSWLYTTDGPSQSPPPAEGDTAIAAVRQPPADIPQSTVAPRYVKLAQQMEHHAALPRMRKLLFYVCYNRWESDPQRLKSLDLPALIETLHRKVPTPSRLKTIIDGFVQTLSKRAEYTQVGNSLTDILQGMYTDAAIAPPVIKLPATEQATIQQSATGNSDAEAVPSPPPTPTPAAQPSLYAQIGSELEREQNLLRIKKLMLFLCKRRWESNAAILNNLNTQEMVAYLHQQNPDFEELETSLTTVVQSLNKQTEYAAIAQTILHHMMRLYPGYAPAHPPEPEPLDQLLEANQEDAAPAIEPTRYDQEQQLALTLFDSRLEIMKYVNPLQAKVLVYASLQGNFQFTNEDWLHLKMVELDGLLRQLLNHCQVYTDMEERLYRTAHRLPDVEDYVAIATRMIKSLRIFYIHGGFAGVMPPVIEETQIHLDDIQATSVEELPSDESDHTFRFTPTTPPAAPAPFPDRTQVRSTRDAAATEDSHSQPPSDPTHLHPPFDRDEVSHATE